MDKQEREEIKEIIKEETKRLATRDDLHGLRDEMLAAFERQAEMIQGEFKRINKRFDTLESRVSKLEERATKVEERLGLMSRQLENISDGVAELRAERKHDVTYILSLEEKVLAERAETQNEYQALSTKLSELEARISKLEGKPNG